MKNMFFIVGALLLGLILGSWSLRADLRKAQQEITSLKEDLNRHGARVGSVNGITAMLRLPGPSQSVGKSQGARTNAALPATTAPAPEGDKDSPQAFQERIKTAMDLWKTRSALARDGFLANTAATPEQTQQFDQTVVAMNQQLGEKITRWSEMMKQQQDLPPEAGVRMVNDLSETMVSAYDKMDHIMPADWRDKAGPEFQMFDFINPEVALPLAEVQKPLKARTHWKIRP